MSRQQRPDLIALGEAVRERRMQCGLSASELAAASGVPLRRLVALEGGRLDPKTELLHELAQGMGMGQAAIYRRAAELQARGGEKPESPASPGEARRSETRGGGAG